MKFVHICFYYNWKLWF